MEWDRSKKDWNLIEMIRIEDWSKKLKNWKNDERLRGRMLGW
jgi:hypothetical protein